MHPTEMLGQLRDLARAAGLEVRDVPRGGAAEGEVGPHSGTCRVRGRVWVMLVSGDDIEERIDVLCGALSAHAGEVLAARYLPPAIRDRLGAAGAGA
jgi:hypothetical protein